MWDFFAIAGIIFFILIAIILISLAFNDNKKDTEDFKKKIIDDYLAEQKKKVEHNQAIENSNKLIESAKKLLSEKKESNEYVIPENVQFLGEDFISQSEIAELQSRKIDKKYFRPRKDVDPEHPYYLKKFVITGSFNYFPDRNDLAELLYNVGADIDTSISKNIHYVVVGENPGWRKMELIEEYGINVLSEDDIINFFQLEK